MKTTGTNHEKLRKGVIGATADSHQTAGNIGLVGGGLAGAAIGPLIGTASGQSGKTPRTRLAVSTYSYWHFRGEKYPVERVIENAAGLGFDGVEILHRQMADESPQYLNRLKQLAFRHGLALPMLNGNG